GVTKFVACGAMIPEIEKNAHYNPRMLMAPEPKLLTTALPASPGVATIPAPPSPEDTKDEVFKDDEFIDVNKLDFDQLNPKQIEFMLKMLSKLRTEAETKPQEQNGELEDSPNDEITPTDK